MSSFIHDHFLLQSKEAIALYEEYAAHLPIIDYHNHLSPKDVALDRKFQNITELWLEGDHYKWRAMRTHGVPEHFITGQALAREKFFHWASTVPATALNPLFHWSYLELKRYFDIDAWLDPNSAEQVYDQCNKKIQAEKFSAQSLLRKLKVKVICTTDDPTDSLEYHQQWNAVNAGFQMYPTFRPDKVWAVQNSTSYLDYLTRLSAVAGVAINHFDDLLTALFQRITFFHALGGRTADHGMSYLYFDEDMLAAAPTHFQRAVNGATLTTHQADQLRGAIVYHLCKKYHELGWVQQFHLGPMRNNNTRMHSALGADAGFDSIGDYSQAASMASFLNALDREQKLAKTILYNLNPADNAVFATMTGNFNDGSAPGKIQWGPAWWFNDQLDGIETQLQQLSGFTLLSRFVGMTTDSRSLLSFSRHEYFRRILCNWLGAAVHKKYLPSRPDFLRKLVEDICYHNAKGYFGFSIK